MVFADFQEGREAVTREEGYQEHIYFRNERGLWVLGDARLRSATGQAIKRLRRARVAYATQARFIGPPSDAEATLAAIQQVQALA